MLYLKFFNPDVKKWEPAVDADDFEWLKEFALDFRDVLRVSMKIVDEKNKMLAFFSRLGVR
jgi:hypothetical protein